MKSIILTLLLSLICFSCKKNNTLNIDTDIIVSVLQEDYKIGIIGKTQALYPKSGYRILFSESRISNHITIKFKKLLVSKIGLDSFFPATCGINLGTLKKQTYNITFELNGQKNTGQLIVGDSSVLVLNSDGNVRPF